MQFTCKKRETTFSTQWICFGIELRKKKNKQTTKQKLKM